MKLSKLATRKSSGFTLIELLIVIAVIGVLASVVLAVINPLEQLSKSRDAGRRSSVTQLGKAMSAYFLNTSNSQYPAVVATWQQNYLVTPGEISSVITVPATTVICAGTTAVQGNVCYTPLTSNTDAVIWTMAESTTEKQKIAGGCASPSVVVIAWIASQGKTGATCVNNASTPPGSGSILY